MVNFLVPLMVCLLIFLCFQVRESRESAIRLVQQAMLQLQSLAPKSKVESDRVYLLEPIERVTQIGARLKLRGSHSAKSCLSICSRSWSILIVKIWVWIQVGDRIV